jgi:hypothetical protein
MLKKEISKWIEIRFLVSNYHAASLCRIWVKLNSKKQQILSKARQLFSKNRLIDYGTTIKDHLNQIQLG